MTILITGGAGFIGSNFIHRWFSETPTPEPLLNLDKLTYAGNPANLKVLEGNAHYHFVQGDIGDSAHVDSLLAEYRPHAILNFAAESHVDRSIADPDGFVQTNVVGTTHLLDTTLKYWQKLPRAEQDAFRFLHVSTDEVYGSLSANDPPFRENTPFAPNSPYAASKASSDNFVRAYFHTYGLPVLTTNCSNNYGPYQYPEKLIPLMIHHALEGMPLPIYGNGRHIRDWLYVDDHCRALTCVLTQGTPGETYNVGGNCELRNLDLVHTLCDALDALRPRPDGRLYRNQITFVTDRPGHDQRYAVDTTKIEHILDWSPQETFKSGIKKTISWYLNHPEWIARAAQTIQREKRLSHA